MTTDFRALCAELLAALEEEASNWNLEPECHPLVDRARAALAEPEPEVPTDDELELLVIAIQALRDPSTDGHDLSSVDRGRELLRSAIARWATSQLGES